jgi:hypothetical protein
MRHPKIIDYFPTGTAAVFPLFAKQTSQIERFVLRNATCFLLNQQVASEIFQLTGKLKLAYRRYICKFHNLSFP